MKLLKNYAIVAVLCLAVTLCGTFISVADENSQKLIYNRDSAVLVFGSGDKAVSEKATDISPVVSNAVRIIKTAAGFAPPPISSIYWIIDLFRKMP